MKMSDFRCDREPDACPTLSWHCSSGLSRQTTIGASQEAERQPHDVWILSFNALAKIGGGLGLAVLFGLAIQWRMRRAGGRKKKRGYIERRRNERGKNS